MIGSFRRQSRLLASYWQSLPTHEAGFREAEPSYDKAQTLCDPGWQSQPTVDHNLYTKYLELETNTYITLALLQHNSITQEYTIHPRYVAILALTLLLLPSTTHLPYVWMAWQGRGSLFIGLQGHWIIGMWQNHSP